MRFLLEKHFDNSNFLGFSLKIKDMLEHIVLCKGRNELNKIATHQMSILEEQNLKILK